MDPRARAVYRVDVRSFFDTDADGLGDINGIAAKIDYIKELGADTLMLSPVFSGEGFMIDPEIGTADDLDALIDKAASRMIGTVLEMRTDMPLNDASDIDRASAAMRYWLDRGAMGIAVNTDALTASGDKRALHRAMCALNRNVFSLYPDCFTVGIGKNVPFEDAVQLTRTENRELLMQLYIPAHMAEAFSPASGCFDRTRCLGYTRAAAAFLLIRSYNLFLCVIKCYHHSHLSRILHLRKNIFQSCFKHTCLFGVRELTRLFFLRSS